MNRGALTASLLVVLAAITLLWILADDGRRGEGAASRPELDEARDAPALLAPSTQASARVSAEADGPHEPSGAPATNGTPPPSRTFGARIVDEHGLPLAGALMSIEVAREPLRSPSLDDGEVSVSVPVERLAQRDWVYVIFSAAGRTQARRTARLDVAGAVFLGEIRLLPAGEVVGRVVDAGGAPVSARVWICDVPGELTDTERERLDALGEGLQGSGPHASCDANGAFRIEQVPTGRRVVVAFHPEHLYTLSPPLEVTQALPCDAGTLVLRAPARAQRIEGIVLAADGSPAAGQSVELWQPGVTRNVEPTVKGGRSDSLGRFGFVVPRGASYHVVLLAADEEIDRVADVSAGSEPVTLRAPPRRRMDIHVLGESDAPLETAWISAFDADSHGLRLEYEQVAPGVLQLELPGRPFYLWVGANEHAGERTDLIHPATAPAQLAFTLARKRGARLHGVVSANGAPVPRARVTAYVPVQRSSRLSTGFATRLESQPALGEAWTDASGAYELLVEKRLELVLLVKRNGSVALEHGPILVAPDDVERRLDLELPAAGSIAGQLLVAEGRDERGGIVGASRGDGEVRAATLGADLAFRFDDLAPGRWQVRLVTENPHLLDDRRTVVAREEASWDVDLAPGASVRHDIDLRHEVACRLHGRVELAPDGPSSWMAYVRHEGLEVDEQGRFSARVFGPGDEWVNVSGQYGPSIAIRLHDRVALAPGDNTWALELRSGSIEIENAPAFQGDGRGSEGSAVRLHWKGGASRGGTVDVRAHGGGPLLLRGLPEGEWRIETRCTQAGTLERRWRTLVDGVVLGALEHRTVAFD